MGTGESTRGAQHVVWTMLVSYVRTVRACEVSHGPGAFQDRRTK